MENHLRIEDLLDGYLNGTLSDTELKEFLLLISKEEHYLNSVIEEWLQKESLAGNADTERRERIYKKIAERMAGVSSSVEEENGKLRDIAKYGWKRLLVAAGVVGLVFSSIWFMLNRNVHEDRKDGLAIIKTSIEDVMPGGDRAMLTLANGKQIILDSAQGKIVQLDNLEVTNKAGRLDYEGQSNKVEYHTLSTPRGGKYKLVLPDGTDVWLNAESSITFPTAFTGKGREVAITGEAYFEVVHNAKQPFQVKVNDMVVEVLGTHFNINSYKDESSIKTTLLEGSVKIKRGDGKTVLLAPGQQAQAGRVTGESIDVTAPDTEQVMAWKNGRFYYNNADLKTIMRQIMRWYNVEVEYSGKVPVRYFTADISRDNNLSAILKVLELSNIHFRLEENAADGYTEKLIVSP